jgi:hypothetical protein
MDEQLYISSLLLLKGRLQYSNVGITLAIVSKENPVFVSAAFGYVG